MEQGNWIKITIKDKRKGPRHVQNLPSKAPSEIFSGKHEGVRRLENWRIYINGTMESWRGRNNACSYTWEWKRAAYRASDDAGDQKCGFENTTPYIKKNITENDQLFVRRINNTRLIDRHCKDKIRRRLKIRCYDVNCWEIRKVERFIIWILFVLEGAGWIVGSEIEVERSFQWGISELNTHTRTTLEIQVRIGGVAFSFRQWLQRFLPYTLSREWIHQQVLIPFRERMLTAHLSRVCDLQPEDIDI